MLFKNKYFYIISAVLGLAYYSQFGGTTTSKNTPAAKQVQTQQTLKTQALNKQITIVAKQHRTRSIFGHHKNTSMYNSTSTAYANNSFSLKHANMLTQEQIQRERRQYAMMKYQQQQKYASKQHVAFQSRENYYNMQKFLKARNLNSGATREAAMKNKQVRSYIAHANYLKQQQRIQEQLKLQEKIKRQYNQ